jgi:monovalent cation:H+ antiporter-2, CPA2 family
MFHDTPLIATIVTGLGLAFVFGAIAQRLRVPPLVGYLLAGVAVGPFTPGFVADPARATELAEEREIARGMIEDFSARQVQKLDRA